eukprot:1155394-Pelagomonas_calceolata.AAC.1
MRLRIEEILHHPKGRTFLLQLSCPRRQFSRLSSRTTWLKPEGYMASVKDSGGQGHYSLLVHHARVWSGALTIQLVPSSNASLQLPDRCNGSTMNKILQADMRLRSDDCLFVHPNSVSHG